MHLWAAGLLLIAGCSSQEPAVAPGATGKQAATEWRLTIIDGRLLQQTLEKPNTITARQTGKSTTFAALCGFSTSTIDGNTAVRQSSPSLFQCTREDIEILTRIEALARSGSIIINDKTLVVRDAAGAEAVFEPTPVHIYPD